MMMPLDHNVRLIMKVWTFVMVSRSMGGVFAQKVASCCKGCKLFREVE